MSTEASGSAPSRMIFVNLPVTDLARSTAFYEALGARKDERFCDDTASCMVLSDIIHVMLLTHNKFRMFTTREIADAKPPRRRYSRYRPRTAPASTTSWAKPARPAARWITVLNRITA
jgi:hypothetical protein